MCILMCSLLACSAVSCGSKDSSSSANSKKTVVPELSDEQKARMKATTDKMNEERKKVFTTPMKWMKTPEKS